MFSIGKNEFFNPSLIGKVLIKNIDYLMYYLGISYENTSNVLV